MNNAALPGRVAHPHAELLRGSAYGVCRVAEVLPGAGKVSYLRVYIAEVMNGASKVRFAEPCVPAGLSSLTQAQLSGPFAMQRHYKARVQLSVLMICRACAVAITSHNHGEARIWSLLQRGGCMSALCCSCTM